MSVFVRVTPSRLVLDGDDLYRVATTLDSAARAAQSALSGTGGMAGNEEAAQEFIDGYGDGAVNTLNAAASYAQTLRGLDTLLQDTANAYKDAGTVGTLETVASRSPSSTPGSAATFSVPSAKAPGPETPLGEFGEFVMDALAQIGVVLPDADTGKLGEAASAWSSFGTSVSSAASQLDGTLTNLASMDIPQAADIRQSRDLIAEKLREIAKAASGADGLSSLCSKQKEQVEAMWEEIGWFLGQMAAEIALDLGLGALLSVATGGLAAPAVVAKIATTVMRWVLKIAALVQKLVALTRMNALAAKVLLRALAEGTQSAIATVTVQAAVNVVAPERAQSLLAAGLGSFAGGSVSGRVGDGGAHILRINSRSGFSRVATNSAVGVTEGAVDGLTDGVVQSAVTGSPVNPLSSAALGALIGGPARTISGGARPNAPAPAAGGSANTTSPGVVVPSSASPDAPSAPSSADAPSAPTANTPTGPQGGGAPSSSAPATAGGTNTDAPDAPVVDGSVETSTPVDASTSVDIPAGDAPLGAGSADAPSVGGGVPDVSPPDAPAPSAADGGSPSSPESSIPSMPDTSAPSTPDTVPSAHERPIHARHGSVRSRHERPIHARHGSVLSRLERPIHARQQRPLEPGQRSPVGRRREYSRCEHVDHVRRARTRCTRLVRAGSAGSAGLVRAGSAGSAGLVNVRRAHVNARHVKARRRRTRRSGERRSRRSCRPLHRTRARCSTQLARRRFARRRAGRRRCLGSGDHAERAVDEQARRGLECFRGRGRRRCRCGGCRFERRPHERRPYD
ncbi:hypothetical protein ELQ92_03610 [Labedella populi]|uniref:Uncharacterized protein n=1 Tax=Labedella populi TaxID=2498850 RepID=A0A444QFC6_9MICO|nr:hypothetical protein [Labedella populi]RWZ68317.1 hypothetical protein ELQ92_03610 [Labedella populi]